jgi:hypothetical protein
MRDDAADESSRRETGDDKGAIGIEVIVDSDHRSSAHRRGTGNHPFKGWRPQSFHDGGRFGKRIDG